MDNNQELIVVVPSEENVPELIEYTVVLGIETEDLHLDEEEMKNAVKCMMSNPHLGFY